MSDSVSFTVPLPPNGLGPNGRLHWRKKNALKLDYMQDVLILTSREVMAYQRAGHGFMDKADVAYDWHSTHQVDADNAIGRMKPVLDFLQGRVLANDRDVRLSYEWHKAASKKDERVIVTVSPRTEKAVQAPLSIDCDGCGQIVTIPLTGDVGCGCAGTRWSVTKLRPR